MNAAVQHLLSSISLLAPEQPKLPDSPWFMMPASVSDANVSNVDDAYNALVYGSVVITVVIAAVMVYFAKRYRAGARSKNELPPPGTLDHHTGLELAWSVPPLLVVIVLFVWGFKSFVQMRTAPKDSYEVKVQGQKWNWIFTYPNGYNDNQLHVPAGRNVKLTISSVDVVHSLFLPAARLKMDAVPGRYTSLWFRADNPGNYPIFCAEYCGTDHSNMVAELVVHKDEEEFDSWLEATNKPPDDPVEHGKLLYGKQGCQACHSLTGAAGVGPSFKGIWDTLQEHESGPASKVDENYVKQSILEPQAHIAKGFGPSMPTYKGKLSDAQIDALIAFIKAQK